MHMLQKHGRINVFLSSFDDRGHCLRPRYFCYLQMHFSKESHRNSYIGIGKKHASYILVKKLVFKKRKEDLVSFV